MTTKKTITKAVIGSGRIVACEHVRNAVARYENDRGHWAFNEDLAQHAVEFIQNLEHTTGDYAGKPFMLEGWQAFIVWNLFGFLNADGSRRFTRAYVEVPRKNGKSTFSSAVMLYGLIADDEPAAQVYSAATKLDQAMMVFGESVRVCQNLPWLNEALTVNNSVNNRRILYGASRTDLTHTFAALTNTTRTLTTNFITLSATRWAHAGSRFCLQLPQRALIVKRLAISIGSIVPMF